MANRVLGYRTAGIQVRSSEGVRLLGNELSGGRAIEVADSTGFVVRDNALAGGAIVAPATGSQESNW